MYVDNGEYLDIYIFSETRQMFGIFCKLNSCNFYIIPNGKCNPNSSYQILLNSASYGSFIEAICTSTGNRNILLLNNGTTVMMATKNTESIGFSIAAKNNPDFESFVLTLNGFDGVLKKMLDENDKRSRK
jgi:hypothetical protein